MDKRRQKQEDSSKHAPADLGQMDRVAKISLLIGLFCALGILLIAVYIDTPNEEYLLSISSLVTSKERLDVLMLLAGCCLVCACATTTWLISLYNSLHVAGPLFRFTRNLQLNPEGNPVPLVQIRSTDYLQDEYRILRDSLQHFFGHYGQVEELLVGVRQAISAGKDPLAQDLMEQLEARIQEVAVDD